MAIERSPPLTRRKVGAGAPKSHQQQGESEKRLGIQNSGAQKTGGKVKRAANNVSDFTGGAVDQGETSEKAGDGDNTHSPDLELQKSQTTQSEENNGGSQDGTRQFESKKPGEVGKLGASAYRPFGSDVGSDSTYCRGGPGQVVCGNPVLEEQKGVQCDKCSNWYHLACQLIPADAYLALQNFPILTWLCTDCKSTLAKQSRVGEKLVHLENKVAGLDISLREHMKLAQASLKEIESGMIQQSALTKRALHEQEKLKASYADVVRNTCTEAVASIQKNATPPKPQQAINIGSQAAHEISGMLDNFMDREKRKLNVVVYNLPEQGDADDSAADKNQKDVSKLCSIIRSELSVNIRVKKAFRVGRRMPERPRLLIVTLESVEAKMELLKLASQLRSSDEWRTLYINPDLTQKEREEGKRLRQELATRRNAGEKNLYIRKGKIIQGHPQEGPLKESGGQVQSSSFHHRPVTDTAGGDPEVQLGNAPTVDMPQEAAGPSGNSGAGGDNPGLPDRCVSGTNREGTSTPSPKQA